MMETSYRDPVLTIKVKQWFYWFYYFSKKGLSTRQGLNVTKYIRPWYPIMVPGPGSWFLALVPGPSWFFLVLPGSSLVPSLVLPVVLPLVLPGSSLGQYPVPAPITTTLYPLPHYPRYPTTRTPPWHGLHVPLAPSRCTR